MHSRDEVIRKWCAAMAIMRRRLREPGPICYEQQLILANFFEQIEGLVVELMHAPHILGIDPKTPRIYGTSVIDDLKPIPPDDWHFTDGKGKDAP